MSSSLSSPLVSSPETPISSASGSVHPELAQRQEHNKESLDVLLWSAPNLLEGLEKCRTERLPMIVHIEGYEHSASVALALLRCAHLYGVSVTLVPHAVSTLDDQVPATQNPVVQTSANPNKN